MQTNPTVFAIFVNVLKILNLGYESLLLLLKS